MAYDMRKKSISVMYGSFNLYKFFRTWSGCYCLDITGNMSALFLSRQSNFHYGTIFCLDNMHMLFEFFFVRALLSEFCCLSFVFEFCCLSAFCCLQHFYLEPLVFRERIYYTCYKSTFLLYGQSHMPSFNCVKKCDQNYLTQILTVLYKVLPEGKLNTLSEYKVEWAHI